MASACRRSGPGRGALITIFVITVAIYAAKHRVHGFGGHAFQLTYAIFIAVVPILLFDYAGLEVPSAGGEEMVNPVRDVPKGGRVVGHCHLPGLRDPDPGHPGRAPPERSVVLGLTISTTTISYLFILPRWSSSGTRAPTSIALTACRSA